MKSYHLALCDLALDTGIHPHDWATKDPDVWVPAMWKAIRLRNLEGGE